MDFFVGKVDGKGRILLPARKREELKIGPSDEVIYEIKGVRHAGGFVRNWEGVLEGAGRDPVKLKHESFARRR